MQSSSRRAFLTGHRVPRDPWELFCVRLARVAKGSVDELEPYHGFGRARLTAEQAADVHHARALCRESNVVLAIDGLESVLETAQQQVLWLAPGRGLSTFQPLEPDSSAWFVQPGVMLGELEAVGFSQFAPLPAHLTVAEWLADRAYWSYPAGRMGESCLVFASVLLDDGTVAGLGPFGQANTRPLQGARLHRLVPALFQLANSEDATLCRRSDSWPARFRLDTLKPQDQASINLANLVAGHGGALGWVEWVVLMPQAAPVLPTQTWPCHDAAVGVAANRLDAGVKHLFDAHGLFS